MYQPLAESQSQGYCKKRKTKDKVRDVKEASDANNRIEGSKEQERLEEKIRMKKGHEKQDEKDYQNWK